MSQDRSLSTRSARSAASKDTSGRAGGGGSSSSGGVFSNVLNSFRQAVHNSGDPKKEEDLNWVDTYKITHRPDRPRVDKRQRLGQRDSEYVLGQLHKMWRHNEQLLEEKRKERKARAEAIAAGSARSISQVRNSRDDERGHSRPNISNSSRDATTRRRRAPSLQISGIGSVPNFSYSSRSPEFSFKTEWLDGDVAHHQPPLHKIPTGEADKDKNKGQIKGRPSSSSSLSSSASSDRMTIRVFHSASVGHGLGLNLTNPVHGEEDFGGFRTNAGTSNGGDRHSGSSPSAPKAIPPSRSQSASPYRLPFRPPAQKEGAARRRQQRSSSPNPPQRFKEKPTVAASPGTMKKLPPPSNLKPQLSTTAKAMRESITSLYVDTDQDSSPSLILSSSPASERASPLTPINDVSDEEDYKNTSPLVGPPTTLQTCPMPLCSKPLFTAADRRHNLCAECRADLQPRQSIFAVAISNPFLDPFPSSSPYGNPCVSANSDTQYDSTIEIAEAELKTLPNIVANNKAKAGTRGHRRNADRVRVTDILPSSPRKKKSSSNGNLVSRFNTDGKNDFRLLPAPLGRKHARRGRPAHLGNNSPGRHRHHITKQKSASSPRSGGSDGESSNSHISFQLARWRTPTPSPSPTLTIRSSPGSTLNARLKRESGPLLEPKIFRPTTPSPSPSPSKGKDSPPACRTPSGSRRRPNGASRTSSSGGADNTADHNKPSHNIEPKEDDDDDDDIYREIDSIIDSYLRRPDAQESANEERKAAVVASYFTTLPIEVEMMKRGFI
ncbi:hypothetical protein F5Y19DRAFT_287158 [Xylariaceae sp. FL1651]|nr:hypothetical protein F5Y19DRAFT_287158 [Xylariaceae sp. FL1651]